MRKNSEGQYSSRRVQWTWEGWQAAQHHSGMVSAAATTGFLAGWCYRGHAGNEQAYAFGEKYARLYGEAAQELIE
jgi:hypothetical protein